MASIVHSIEINRRPEEVFAYLGELERHSEWQSQIVSSTRDTAGPTAVGTRATDVRRFPVGTQAVSYEIVELEPPRLAAFRGLNGPVRPYGRVTVDPVGESASLVTIDLDLRPHGLFGLLVAPMARAQARKLMPKDQAALKQRLESGAA